MRCRLLFALGLTFLLQQQARSSNELPQTPVSASDFSLSSPMVKPGTGVLVLSDIGESSLLFDGNHWVVVFKRSRRIRILDKSGLDASTVSLGFSARENSNQKLESLKASTYNLVGDRIEKTDLDSSQVFLAQGKDRDEVDERFAMPNAKEGSIIEYSFTVRSSDIFQLCPWNFQCEYPVLKSQYSVMIPGFFNYAISPHGNISLKGRTVTSEFKGIQVPSGFLRTEVFTISWSLQNVNAVPNERYVFRPASNVSGIAFQLSAYPDAHNSPCNVLRNWSGIVEKLLAWEIYNEASGHTGKKIKQEANMITAGAPDEEGKAKKIFAYVRDSIRTDQVAGWPSAGPTETLKKKFGNGGDKSLLLSTMLTLIGIPARTVFVATRYADPLYPVYPFPENANRVITRAVIGNRIVFLDPVHRNLSFGRLLSEYFDGYAIAVEPGAPVYFLDADSLVEKTSLKITASISDSGTVRAGIRISAGANETYRLKEILSDPVTAKSYFPGLKTKVGAADSVNGVIQLPVDDSDSGAVITYSIRLEPATGNLIYLNGLLNHNQTNNPFPATNRFNPAQFDYRIDDEFDIEIKLPENYQVESLPQAASRNLNGSDGFFEYSVTSDKSVVRIHRHYSLNRVEFPVDLYPALRNFFSFIIDKEGQMIVLKKK